MVLPQQGWVYNWEKNKKYGDKETSYPENKLKEENRCERESEPKKSASRNSHIFDLTQESKSYVF